MQRYYKYLALFIIFPGLFGCSTEEVPWQGLFDGTSIDSWVQRGGEALYEARDGMIIGTTVVGTPNSFLCTPKNYANFILELEVKVDTSLNSGIQIRSNAYKTYRNSRVHGYQVEIDPSPRSYSGGIYDEARRGWLKHLADNKPAREAFKRDDWNHYRIKAIDDTMKTWINGVMAVEVVDIMTDSGFIALQVHSTSKKRPMQVMWKNIRIKNLGFKETKAFNVRRGTNISHWLSQSDRRGEERKAFFTEKDVKYLAGLGFDHLRIPVDEEQLWDESGKRDEEAFMLLKSGLDLCQKYNLKAIVDLHILRSHHFNKEDKPLWTDPAAQDQFIDLWRDLSSQLKIYPISMVAYEFMNEAVADDPEDWNKLIDRVYKEVRKLEPNRVVVIGSNRWQTVDTFDQLRVPENDKNIILSYHMYEPFLFTHYKASWTKIHKYTGPVIYPGLTVEENIIKKLPRKLAQEMRSHNSEYDQQALIRMLEKPLALSKKYGLPLYCGEWGCLPTVPEKMRWHWYEDMRTIFDVYGIAYANWDYKGSFGLIDRDGNPVDSMIQILVPDY